MVEACLLNSCAQAGKSLGVRLGALPFGIYLVVERNKLGGESVFVLAFFGSHSFAYIDSSATQDVEQNAALSAFSIRESACRVTLFDQQPYHRVVRIKIAFEKALQLLLLAGHAGAHVFDDRDGFIKGCSRLGRLVHSLVSTAGGDSRVHRGLDLTHL